MKSLTTSTIRATQSISHLNTDGGGQGRLDQPSEELTGLGRDLFSEVASARHPLHLRTRNPQSKGNYLRMGPEASRNHKNIELALQRQEYRPEQFKNRFRVYDMVKSRLAEVFCSLGKSERIEEIDDGHAYFVAASRAQEGKLTLVKRLFQNNSIKDLEGYLAVATILAGTQPKICFDVP